MDSIRMQLHIGQGKNFPVKRYAAQGFSARTVHNPLDYRRSISVIDLRQIRQLISQGHFFKFYRSDNHRIRQVTAGNGQTYLLVIVRR
ncbi:hypothetical protein D3C81_1832010 [compost metagenome]